MSVVYVDVPGTNYRSCSHVVVAVRMIGKPGAPLMGLRLDARGDRYTFTCHQCQASAQHQQPETD